MSHALSEVAASADFVTPLTVPDNGDDFTASCAVVVSAEQAIANREQWLKSWLPNSPVMRIPLVPTINTSSRFTAQTGTAAAWGQTSVADVGGLLFSLSGLLPAGRKIQSVTATIQNQFTTNVAIGTKPAIELKRQICTAGGAFSSLGVVTDPTAVLATYQVNHDFGISALGHTIDANSEYAILFTGETGANSVIGLILMRIYVTLGF